MCPLAEALLLESKKSFMIYMYGSTTANKVLVDNYGIHLGKLRGRIY